MLDKGEPRVGDLVGALMGILQHPPSRPPSCLPSPGPPTLLLPRLLPLPLRHVRRRCAAPSTAVVLPRLSSSRLRRGHGESDNSEPGYDKRDYNHRATVFANATQLRPPAKGSRRAALT